MKYKIVTHFSKEDGRVIQYELKEKPLFFLPWKSLRLYKSEESLDHDLVWLFSLDGKVKRGEEFD